RTPYSANIGYVNVPHGGSKSLHLYTRAYGASTGTGGENIEVVLNAASPEAARLRFDRPIVATVSAIRYSGGDAPIGYGQLVLSTKADSATAEALRRMAPDMRVELSATDLDGGALSRSKECLGMYYLLYDHGNWVSEGTNPNPRTLLGLKNDGSILLYVLDGRQPGISGGLGLTDVAKHMVELGCVVIANLDGGGSSTMLVREPGKDATAVLKNSPSGGAQRAVANGLFLVYKGLSADGGSVLSAYQDHYLALPGAEVKLTAYRSNGLYERSGAGAVGGLRYEVTEGGGSVSENGVYTAGDAPGKVRIKLQNDNAETTVSLEVVTRDLSLTPSVTELFADPRQSVDLNVTARHGYAPVAQRDELFTWECDANVGAIDESGVFTAIDRTGVSGEIRISYNDKTVTVPVQVGAQISFTDLFDPATGADHWAKSHIESLASQGIVNGIGDDLFGPEFALTRAQFLAMLAKTVDGLDLNASPPSGFEDVPMEGWYYAYVNWGHAAGVVKGVDETHFAPDLPITREQMTVMLANFAAIMGMRLPDTGMALEFTDFTAISPWASEAVGLIVRAGIMNGMPEGGFEPQAGATRAQAAKVAYMLCALRAQTPDEPLPPADGTQTQPAPEESGGATDTDGAQTQPAPEESGGATDTDGTQTQPAPEESGDATDTDGTQTQPAPEESGGAAGAEGDVPVH
ncbi:MAG: S-layer homology domain-containing protein, partial [Clostridiales Family XIII bacterium]|nr:S-layer homology domain-containing protein [Clostridiales Family XIII bacterium]